jgi:hypothetical protein
MTKSLALILLATAACGDNRQAADQPDAAVTVDAGPQPLRAVVVAGDFAAGHPGVMSVIDVKARTITTNVAPALAIGNDPVLRKIGDELLVVNRASGNNVTILDANTYALVEQLGTGAGSNPQDVAVIGEKVFVATLGNKGAVMLTRGSTTITEIDLSADDPDGKPNCNSVAYAYNKLYVSCGLLDDTNVNLPPRGPGKVYVVNPTTLEIEKTITLATSNPIALFEQVPATSPHANDLVIPTIDFGTGAGCIERVATASATGVGCLVQNPAPFAFSGRVAFTADAQAPLMALGVLSYPDGYVRNFDLATDTMLPNTLTPTSQVVGDIAACPTGELVIADNPFPPSTAPAGIRIYEGATEKTTAPLAVGLKPASSHGIICY